MGRTKQTTRDIVGDPHLGMMATNPPDISAEIQRIDVEMVGFKKKRLKEEIAKVNQEDDWDIDEITNMVNEEIVQRREDLIQKARGIAIAKRLEEHTKEKVKQLAEAKRLEKLAKVERQKKRLQDAVGDSQKTRVENSSDYEDEIEEEELHDDEDDTLVTKTAKKKSKLESMTREEIVKAFMQCGFSGTTYPDLDTTKILGFEDDYKELIMKCGLGKFVTMKENTHPRATAEFLATVKYEEAKGPSLSKTLGGGHIDFVINGEDYMISLLELDQLFGFPHGNATAVKMSKEEKDKVWKYLTGAEKFKGGTKENVRVRSPVVSYARRVIAETFYSRTKTGPTHAGDLELLTRGLKGILDDNMIGDEKLVGDTKGGGLAYAFVKQLESYRTKLSVNLTRGTKGTNICIGGPIACILRAKGVVGIDLDRKIPNEEKHLRAKTMNLAYLREQDLLTKTTYGSKLYYRFVSDGEESVIELPNKEMTSFEDPTNIEFTPEEEVVIPYSSLVPLVTESPKKTLASSSTEKKKVTPSTKSKGKAPQVAPTLTSDQIDLLEERLMERLSEQTEDLFKGEWKTKIVKILTPIVIQDLLPLVTEQVTKDLTTSITASITASLSSAFVEKLTPALLDKLTPAITERVETHLARQMKKARLEKTQADKRPLPDSTTTPPHHAQKQPRHRSPSRGAATSTPLAPAKPKNPSRTTAPGAA